MAYQPTTNFEDSNEVDLGKKLVSKGYLLEVYGSVLESLGNSGLTVTPELWIWGDSNENRLGIYQSGTGTRQTPVTTFAGGFNWKQVSLLETTGHAIKTDGTLWGWGNGSDLLGIDRSFNQSIATPVSIFGGATNWRQVGGTAAIKTDGTLWVWGVRTGTNTDHNSTKKTPVTTFAGGNDWKQVSSYFTSYAAVKTDGTLWVWGENNNLQLGTNDNIEKSTPVTTFAGGNDWKQVAIKNYGGAAIKTDGTLWVWGFRNFMGYLGTNDGQDKSTPVTTFAGGNDWKQVAIAHHNYNSCSMAAVKTDGTLWTWGNVASGSNSVSITPITTFAGGTNWKQVAVNEQNALAIKTDGTLWVWGGGAGLGVISNVVTPVPVYGAGNNWKQVSAARFHSAAIQSIDYI